ncbi:MAG TPA: TIGR04282 family arsenosugar biosynthesis glycosyltransferase [Noviherbaspirillum sp.]|uniref:TIGR04282 family arsenosugar biosynthesis glycosyltransferase n=1 Tax=Noviherbaspirillum sp. TaxID=1926288 RepID=UPI002D49D766|nr:TIGR04282 family arsenosugar biosynthesis glycosyltransferase [Noviherbaspirillum sp.]HYD96575.1 TIGR04282 family arsenosugar biosynthesis glycosyltransferase [Noviherbaspirillum sp.]
MKDDCAIIVFAKDPVPGHAKTRLIPALGAEGAARLALRMLRETLSSAVAAGAGPVELCCTPDQTSAVVRDEAARHGLGLTAQGEGDLGERMCRALARQLAVHPRAIVIGTDCPTLHPQVLRHAARLLRTKQAVFAPASDGGYVLVGLAAPLPALFQDIPWSTGAVMARTRERIARLGIAAAELPLMHDVDEAQDLVHVPTGWLG